MGNDKCFVECEDLPFRFIEIPIASAPPEERQPIRTYDKDNYKFNDKIIEMSRFEGYDAPPSLLPPPTIPKRYDEPILIVPQRSDLYKLNSNKIPSKSSSVPKHHHHYHHRRKFAKTKLTCCVIS
ncbi:unnamed protein product [Rotaria sp. Silwood1]|nr:unnamed protein product [Rotaria sp. Silwood1]CAF1684287.1 unnamed protein product [Rotaria sp. Silwood1]